MFGISVLQPVLLVYQQEEMLCLDAERHFFMRREPLAGIQVTSSDGAAEICTLPRCHLLLWKLAVAPGFILRHSCCLHNHKATGALGYETSSSDKRYLFFVILRYVFVLKTVTVTIKGPIVGKTRVF